MGWENFVTLSKRFSKVTLLTRTLYKEAIEQNSYFQSQSHVTTVYYELPGWLDKMENTRVGFQAHPYIWEVFVFPFLLKRFKRNQFDIAQKVTTGSYRYPSLTWYFARKFIWGPIASGERYNIRLISIFSRKGMVVELFRMIVQRIVLFDPLVRLTLHRSSQIIAISNDTRSILPSFARRKTTVNQKYISVKAEDYNLDLRFAIVKDTQTLKLLFIGRLLEWKGVMFVLEALKKIHGRIPYEFTIVGDGPDYGHFHSYAVKNNLRVVFHKEWVNRRDLSSFYYSHHLFMFPCLHAVTGFVFLESLLHELPVLALDITGAEELVGKNYGIEIPTSSRNKRQVVQDIADKLLRFFDETFTKIDSTEGQTPVKVY
jgi:glycosyltransferase involved in cell wall biosynthesis